MYPSQDKVLSDLVDQLGAPNFEKAFLEAVDSLVAFDMAMIATYEQNRISSCLSHRFPGGPASKAFQTFQDATFRVNPFYIFHLNGIDSGVYLMENLLKRSPMERPNAYTDKIVIDDREEVGYLTPGWPPGLRELDFVVRTGPTRTVQIALYRADAGRFNSHDVSRLAAMRMTLASIFRKASASAGHEAAGGDAAEIMFDSHSLSARERQVMRLALAGLSVEDTAERLGVGLETVKTHRKRAYLKMEISSKDDLFTKILSARASRKPS